MINYVNNSFDKVLKPCDAQKFMELTQSELTEKLILGHRAGEKNSKAKLPALTYMGVLDEPRYRAYLEQCEAQGSKPLGSRRAEFMRPTGLLMLDFDHVGDPIKLWETIKERMASHPSLGRRDVKASVATAETLVSQRSPAEQALGEASFFTISTTSSHGSCASAQVVARRGHSRAASHQDPHR